MSRKTMGASGEQAACEMLVRSGRMILERNYRRPTGEIDIIAREKSTILFIEVKTRSSLRYGRPAEAVNHTKRLHILRTAMIYLGENNLEDVPVRFDVIEVLPTGVELLQNAFDASELAED